LQKINHVELTRHGKPIPTVFDLLGHKENNITAAIGWTLANCHDFLHQFLSVVASEGSIGDVKNIELKKYGEDKGFTDIEISTENCHIIVEAKCGWTLPTDAQLLKYANRFKVKTSKAVLIVVSAFRDYVTHGKLPEKIGGFRVRHIGYKELMEIAKRTLSDCRNSDRRVLKDLTQYLGVVMNASSRTSNMVYVVPLALSTPSFSSLSWIDIVEKAGFYFHPVGTSGWPVEPATYLGFRYAGRLQSIRFVENCVVAPDGNGIHAAIPEISAARWTRSPDVKPGQHFVYKLGPPIVPGHVVKSGNIWTSRRWAAIDLLLTSKSISEAAELTKKRKA
jgi:hypothetical protein